MLGVTNKIPNIVTIYYNFSSFKGLTKTDGSNSKDHKSCSTDLSSVPNNVAIVNSQNQTSPSIDIVVDNSTLVNNSSTNTVVLSRHVTTKPNQETTKDNNNLLGLPSSNLSASTCETSENDNISTGDAGSLESLDVKMWHRPNSDPSSISSISLDSQTEEAVLDFMRRFTSILFADSASITVELKAEFGQYSRVRNSIFKNLH